MLTVTLLLLETVQEHKVETHIRPKHEEKVIKLFWNTPQVGQVLFHLQWKIRAEKSLFEALLLLRAAWVSSCHPALHTDNNSTALSTTGLFLVFDAHCLFVCQNDIMPNQGVFQILITLLGVHYLCERAQTAIKPALGKKMCTLAMTVKDRVKTSPRARRSRCLPCR